MAEMAPTTAALGPSPPGHDLRAATVAPTADAPTADAPTADAPTAEATTADMPVPPTSRATQPGTLTKRTGRKPTRAESGKGGKEQPACGSSGNWNKFGRGTPPTRPTVSLSRYSKEERTKLSQWQEERQCALRCIVHLHGPD
jgi:hypothetical protein